MTYEDWLESKEYDNWRNDMADAGEPWPSEALEEAEYLRLNPEKFQ